MVLRSSRAQDHFSKYTELNLLLREDSYRADKTDDCRGSLAPSTWKLVVVTRCSRGKAASPIGRLRHVLTTSISSVFLPSLSSGGDIEAIGVGPYTAGIFAIDFYLGHYHYLAEVDISLALGQCGEVELGCINCVARIVGKVLISLCRPVKERIYCHWLRAFTVGVECDIPCSLASGRQSARVPGNLQCLRQLLHPCGIR